MNHQLYEEWMLRADLPPDSAVELQNHLAGCDQCLQLSRSLQVTDGLLASAKLQGPSEGFSNRWLAYAGNKENDYRKSQIHLYLAGLGIYLLSVVILAIVVFSGNPPWPFHIPDFFISILILWQKLVINLRSYAFAFTLIPFRIPPVIWVPIAFNALAWMGIWSLSIWRIAFANRRTSTGRLS